MFLPSKHAFTIYICSSYKKSQTVNPSKLSIYILVLPYLNEKYRNTNDYLNTASVLDFWFVNMKRDGNKILTYYLNT